jgi:hypothetical protein
VVVKQDTDWKYSAIADSETQSSRDAQAMAKRNVYDKAARWAESIMPRVRERFALTDTADMLAYLNLAKDDAITSLSMRVKTYDYGRTQFESVVRVKPETVHDTFRRYLVGGARYVTPAERPAYREWCINQVRLP